MANNNIVAEEMMPNHIVFASAVADANGISFCAHR
jgi:hypothetical protein